MPKMSVVTPNYNRAALIGDSIRSVLSQSFTELELIVVDDGSTDDSIATIRAISDPRLRLLSQANGGPGRARSRALSAAQGEYIAFLDSDDLFCPGKLEKQMALFERQPEIGLSFTGTRTIDEHGQESPVASGGEAARIDLERLITGPAFTFSSVVVRRQWIEAAGPLHQVAPDADEWEWMMRLAMSGCVMQGIPEALVLKRVHSQNYVRNPATIEKSGLRALEAVFADPSFPRSLQSRHCVARAYHFARLAGLACADNDVATATAYGMRSIEELAQQPEHEWHNVALRLIHIAQGVALSDTNPALSAVAAQLASRGSAAARLARILQSTRYAVEANKSFVRGDRSGVLRNGLRHFLAAFPKTVNRGVATMMVKSMAGKY